MVNEYKGRSLFLDVEDRDIRIQNQAAVLSNIICENSADKVTLRSGLKVYQGYFSMVFPDDRAEILVRVSQILAERINSGTVMEVANNDGY